MAADTASVSAFGVSIPLRAPFRTAGVSITHRSVLLVRAERDGHHGWGEAAPFPGQDESMEELVVSAQRGIPTPTLLAAIDEALTDLDAR
jgi:L-alanine-DL-glutamate epimerase-like enolase superfamily enzyme